MPLSLVPLVLGTTFVFIWALAGQIVIDEKG